MTSFGKSCLVIGRFPFLVRRVLGVIYLTYPPAAKLCSGAFRLSVFEDYDGTLAEGIAIRAIFHKQFF